MPKISELSSETVLTGAELVPIVQSGVTERTTVDAIAARAFSTSVRGYLYAADFGPANTTNIQAAVDAAVAQGLILLLEPGICSLTAEIVISGAVRIIGQGLNNNGTVFWLTTLNQNGFFINTTQAVVLEHFQIQAITNPTAGAAIVVDPGAGNSSRDCRFKSLQFYNNYKGIDFIRAGAWIVDDVISITFTSPRGAHITIDNIENADDGGCIIQNSTFWTDTTVASTDIGILQKSLGDIRIVGNNFLNLYAAYHMNLRTTAVSGQLVIANNVFDGPIVNGIKFETTNTATTAYFNTVVSANVFRLTNNANGIHVGNAANWLNSFNFVGNQIDVAGSGQGIHLDSGGTGNISGNIIGTGSAAAVGISLSSTVSAVNTFQNTIVGFTAGNVLQDASINKPLWGQYPFPATQNASTDPNTLDDYAEVTFTPSLSFATPGDLAVTYGAARNAWATKVGREVFAHVHIQAATLTYTTASGNLVVTGAPYSATSPSGNHAARNGGIQWEGITIATHTDMCPSIGNGNATINIRASGDGVAAIAISTTHIASAPALLPLFRFGLGYTV